MRNMMKKIVCGAAALATLVTSAAFCSTTVSASDLWDGYVGYNEQSRHHYDKNLNGWVVTAVIKGSEKIRFPEYMDNYRQRKLALVESHALDRCDNMKLVIIDSPTARVEANDYYFSNRDFCVMWDKRNPYKPTGSTGYRYGYFRLGDADGNDKVDVVDAQKILKAATEILAGNKDGSAPSTLARMDVNRDGLVDVEDAQYTLKYYTEIVVAKKKNITFEDYMFPYQPKAK